MGGGTNWGLVFEACFKYSFFAITFPTIDLAEAAEHLFAKMTRAQHNVASCDSDITAFDLKAP